MKSMVRCRVCRYARWKVGARSCVLTPRYSSPLQWREDIESEQDPVSCSIPFIEIVEVTMPEEPVNSFQIVTSAPRTVVFQCRPEQEACSGDRAADKPKCIDAEQWCEYLDVFSQYARQQARSDHCTEYSNQHSPTTTGAYAPQRRFRQPRVSQRNAPAFDEVTFARITRAILNEDVTALEELFVSDEGNCHLMCDESGSSLLIVAVKLGAAPHIIRALLSVGVDCNAKNNEYVPFVIETCRLCK